MDPCPFVQVIVGSLALKIPPVAPPASAIVQPSTTSCFAKIRLEKFPYQTVAIPLFSPEDDAVAVAVADPFSVAARIHLSKAYLERIASRSSIFACTAGLAKLKVSIYIGRQGSAFRVSAGQLLGKVKVPLDLKELAKDGGASGTVEFHSGWVSLGKKKAIAWKSFPSSSASSREAQLFLTVKVEPDPRFVFQFDGEPECSPQVFHVQGNMRQPVFTCKFGCRNATDRSMDSRSSSLSQSASARSWFSSLGSDRERPGKERKGWSVTVHDLSGSPVALASMVTPFVASPGTDRVSQSNPGAWLVLRPGNGTWKPWGRLEAWRQRGGAGAGDSLGYRFELLPDAAMGACINLAESTISTVKGGQFAIDLKTLPECSPIEGLELGVDTLWPFSSNRGFVMSATVGGEGRSCSPTVEVGVQHVGCAEDAAAFVALTAAVDLSMNACRLFSYRLRKERSAPDLLRHASTRVASTV